MTIGHARHGVTEDLDGRFREMFVVIRSTCLAEIFEQPGSRLTRFRVQLGLDSSEFAELLKTLVGTSPASQEHGIVGTRVLWHDTSDVGVHDTIHRPVEDLACFHPSIEEPSPPRLFLDLAIWRLPLPRDVAPQDGFVEGRAFPNGTGVNVMRSSALH